MFEAAAVAIRHVSFEDLGSFGAPIEEAGFILRERTAALKSERERAKAALDRTRAQCGNASSIDASKIDAFAGLMNERLENADTNPAMATSARSSTPWKSTMAPSGSSAAKISCKPPSQATDRERKCS